MSLTRENHPGGGHLDFIAAETPAVGAICWRENTSLLHTSSDRKMQRQIGAAQQGSGKISYTFTAKRTWCILQSRKDRILQRPDAHNAQCKHILFLIVAPVSFWGHTYIWIVVLKSSTLVSFPVFCLCSYWFPLYLQRTLCTRCVLHLQVTCIWMHLVNCFQVYA